MLPTERTIRWAAGLAALALLAFLTGAPWSLARFIVALCGLLFGALVFDLWRIPSPRNWSARREVPEVCGLGGDLQRVVVVSLGSGGAGLPVELREEFPGTCEVTLRTCRTTGQAEAVGLEPVADATDPTGGPDRAVLDSAGNARLERHYRPARRGRLQLGSLRVRVRGAWGLAEREVELAGDQPFDVEPALAGLSRTLVLAASERWQDLGVRRLRRIGGRTEFESLRDYTFGDDPRQMDWKATARRGKPTVRQFEEERGQELVLLVDCGRRMRAATESGAKAGWTKLDWALDAALQLAAVALARGDRVGCLAFDDRVLAYESPKRGARQLQRLRPALFALQPSTRETDYGHALRSLAVRHRRSALVLIVSDVADPLSLPAQRKMLQRSARRHQVVFAALDDPLLRQLAEPRESSAAVAEELPRAALRAVAIELDEERRSALRELAGGGVRVVNALPAEAAAPLLAAWLSARG